MIKLSPGGWILGLLAALAVGATPTVAAAQQPPALPHAFFGTLEVNGAPAPPGVQVEARGNGVRTELPGNPLITTETGRYGGASLYEAKLIVQGSIENGDPVEFFVNGNQAECAVPGGEWQSSYPFRSGDVTQLLLKVGAAATMPDTITATPTPTRTRTPTSSSAARATATRQPTDAPTEAAPIVVPTQPPALSSTPPASTPPPQAATVTSAPVTDPASASALPEVEPTPAALATAAPTSATAADTATVEAPMPTGTPAVVAQKAKATARPILAPETPTSEAPAPAGPPAGGLNPRGLLLKLGLVVLGLAVFGGAGMIIYNRLR